jgi:membrane fusion protein, multidrug efflux system
MKRITIISLTIIFLVGACTLTLLYNKKKIDEKSHLDGNLSRIPVFVVRSARTIMDKDFEVSGTFSADHELTLMSEGQGKVVQLLFNTGDMVQPGQLMVKLDDDLVRSNLSLAQAALDKSRKELKKFEELLKSDAVSSQQVDDARLAEQKAETDVTTLKKQLDYASITAPIPGTVTKRLIEKGSLVMPGTPVAEIVDVSRLKMIAPVAESEVMMITRGKPVKITSSLHPGIVYKGTVTSVGVKADDARRFPVEVELVNDLSNPLKAGMFGIAKFSFDGSKEALTIPRHAIVGSIKTPRIYVVENDRAILKEIRIGSANDREVEVLDGLKEGELVVTSGQINLDNNSLVKIVENK